MVVRFVFGCAFFLALSIIAIPVFYGVATNKEMVTASVMETQAEESLSFAEIYEIASEGQDIDPAALNAIMPAAGDEEPDGFSFGFANIGDAALADTAKEILTEGENPDL